VAHSAYLSEVRPLPLVDIADFMSINESAGKALRRFFIPRRMKFQSVSALTMALKIHQEIPCC
jgi:hypothetical protein